MLCWITREEGMTMYAVQATVETVRGVWTGMKQIPTFYLDESVQGIVSEEHAQRVALDILRSAVPADIAMTFHVTAVKV